MKLVWALTLCWVSLACLRLPVSLASVRSRGLVWDGWAGLACVPWTSGFGRRGNLWRIGFNYLERVAVIPEHLEQPSESCAKRTPS